MIAPLSTGLRRRLFLLLMVPLAVLASLNTWFDYRAASNVALQQDRQLLGLVPLLADSLVARGSGSEDPPVMLTAPVVQEFLRNRPGIAEFAVIGMDGQVVLGDTRLQSPVPTTPEPEFSSEVIEGVTYRIVSQRVQTGAGEWVVRLADGSDPRQQWLQLVLLRVVLPNVVLVVAALFAVHWAVDRALRPLTALTQALQRRSPRDLSALDPAASPEEVRPLVLAINRLFGLVNVQAESQRRFVADAAHQLRTPLAGLQSQAEAWAQAVITTERQRPHDPVHPDNAAQPTITLQAEQVLKLRQATRRTSQLANQLLALSRADAHSALDEPLQRVDLVDLCEAVLEQHLDAATTKSLDLGLEAHAAQVDGHMWLLRELLSNLVDNAIKYTPAGGHVTLRCGLQGPHAYLEVEDDGPGVPAAERSRIVERFYRVTGTPGEGNGLGLAIAQEIARVHHSSLCMEAGAAGRGLRVRLPFGGTTPCADAV